MQMKLVEDAGDMIHLSLDGRLDTFGVDEIEVKFNATIGARRKHILIDMADVTFLSSMGIRMLLTMAKVALGNGGRCLLMKPQPLVAETIEMASLEEVMPVIDSVADARKIFQS